MDKRILQERHDVTSAYGRKGWVKKPGTRCNRADKAGRKRFIRRRERRVANALTLDWE